MTAYLRNWPVLLLIVLALYLLLAALQGDTGFFRYLQLQAQIDQQETQLVTLIEDRKTLENLTHRMSDSYLDLDLLDEQARKRLGLVRADEIIIR